MKNVELLSPAGNMDCLAAAVQNGADAVYFGGGAFNARRGAANFTGNDLKAAIDYCRLRGVKTYITLNILLFDRELSDAIRFANEVYTAGGDSVIVQDIGLAGILHNELPGLTLHASTQMGIHDLNGLDLCKANGIERVVLSREVPLKEIRRMSQNSDIELEFFCHGALCMSFSGSCLYSSMAGERSGNRGTCAQPCRKSATVLEKKRAGENELALSPNDICMIDELNALRDAGIRCLKIEGRMKSPEYVSIVTRQYREALDGISDRKRARTILFDTFNRGNFSTSHLYGDSVRTGGIGCAKPSRELLALAHESVRGENIKRTVNAVLDITEGDPAKLTFVSAGITVRVEGDIVQRADKPANAERYAEQVKKLGGTPFEVGECSVTGSGFLPMSAVNSMRRDCVEALTKVILNSKERGCGLKSFTDADLERYTKIEELPFETIPKTEFGRTVYVRVRDIVHVEEAFESGASTVGYEPVEPGKVDKEALKKIKESLCEKKLILILPNVLITEGARKSYLDLIKSGVFDGAEANNIGQVNMLKDVAIRIAGIGINAASRATVARLINNGFTHVMPSLELTKAQTRDIAAVFGDRLILNTRLRAPVMQLLHCPVKEYCGCATCKGFAGWITDGEGRRFPLSNMRFQEKEDGVKSAYCLVRMKNSVVTDISDLTDEVGSVSAYAVTVDECDTLPVSTIVKDAVSGIARVENVTRGHWNRRVT